MLHWQCLQAAGHYISSFDKIAGLLFTDTSTHRASELQSTLHLYKSGTHSECFSVYSISSEVPNALVIRDVVSCVTDRRNKT